MTEDMMANSGDGLQYHKARLIMPVLALLATGVAVAGVVLFLAARSLDARAVETTTQLARSALAAEQRFIANLAFDYTWWDDMAAHVVDTYDASWADLNIGSYLTETYGIGYSFMVDRGDSTIAAFIDGNVSADTDAFKIFPASMRPLVDRARAAPMEKPEPVSALVLREGVIHAIVASAVTPENPTADQLRRRTRPVLVMAREIDEGRLRGMARDFLLNDLHIDTAPAGKGSSSIILADITGTPIAHLIWRPAMPGHDLLRGLLPTLLLTFLVMGLLTFLFLRRTQAAWREKSILQMRLAREVDARRHDAELAHLQRFNTLGEMTTTFAHELNQPLTVISSYVQGCVDSLRRDRHDTASLLNALEQVAAQTDRIDKIIRRIRAFVRKEEPDPIKADINQIIKDAVYLLQADLRENNVELELNLTDDLPAVLVNQIQVQQVVVNLMSNSIDALLERDATSRQLIVRTGVTNESMIEVVIEDTGPGIPEENHEKVFDAFFSSKTDSMGMGLAISRSIIEAHGGRLSVADTDNDDTGAAFMFALPIHTEAHDDAA